MDPDGDGLANLVEYALGYQPRVATAAGLPGVTASASEWIYTYTRPAGRGDVSFAVEISIELTDWTTGGVTHVLVSTDPATGAQIWRGSVERSAAHAFFRLKVSRP